MWAQHVLIINQNSHLNINKKGRIKELDAKCVILMDTNHERHPPGDNAIKRKILAKCKTTKVIDGHHATQLFGRSTLSNRNGDSAGDSHHHDDDFINFETEEAQSPNV